MPAYHAPVIERCNQCTSVGCERAYSLSNRYHRDVAELCYDQVWY